MMMNRKQGRGILMTVITVIACAAVLAVSALVLTGCIGNKTYHVGKDIKIDDINEFWYTYSSSTNPPEYQRWRFYKENGNLYFYHEKREGDHWPLTEEDVTVNGTVTLSEEQWNALFACIDGGSVTRRTESTAAGGAGPFLYLYWKNDGAKIQEYSFADYGKQKEFEALCQGLEEAGN